MVLIHQKDRVKSSNVTWCARFAKLCYHLVQSGSIKKQAELDPSGERIIFPSLGLELDMVRAQTFGMMVVSEERIVLFILSLVCPGESGGHQGGMRVQTPLPGRVPHRPPCPHHRGAPQGDSKYIALISICSNYGISSSFKIHINLSRKIYAIYAIFKIINNNGISS